LIAYFRVSASSDSLPFGKQFEVSVEISSEAMPKLLFFKSLSEITPRAMFKPLVTDMLSSVELGLNRLMISKTKGEFEESALSSLN
jgi:hypothetical protein